MTQLLLTDQRFKPSRLWEGLDMDRAKDLVESYRRAFPAMTAIWDEYIDFEPSYRDETILYVDSRGVVVEERTRRVPISRKLAPFVKPLEGSPTGRVPRDPPIHDLIHGERVYTVKLDTMRIDEIDLQRVDFSQIEQHIIGIRHAAEAMRLAALGASEAMQRFTENAVFGEPYESRRKAPPAYHQHDRTKSHKRGRRK